MPLKIHRFTQPEVEEAFLTHWWTPYSKLIAARGQLQVVKVLPVHPLIVQTDLTCLVCQMAVNALQTGHLLEFERNWPALAEGSELQLTTLEYSAVHSAVINSRINMTGCAMRIPSISTWRIGRVHHLEAQLYYHQLVASIAPIAISWIQPLSTLSSITMERVRNRPGNFTERIISSSTCAFSTIWTPCHLSTTGNR